VEWISVNDIMPKNNQNVKVKCEFRYKDYWHAEAIFKDNEFIYSKIKGYCFGDATHWMALPEPPIEP